MIKHNLYFFLQQQFQNYRAKNKTFISNYLTFSFFILLSKWQWRKRKCKNNFCEWCARCFVSIIENDTDNLNIDFCLYFQASTNITFWIQNKLNWIKRFESIGKFFTASISRFGIFDLELFPRGALQRSVFLILVRFSRYLGFSKLNTPQRLKKPCTVKIVFLIAERTLMHVLR